MKNINVLLVDDHPMVLEAFESILVNSNTDVRKVNVDCALNCDEAIHYIEASEMGEPYDILFLDINLPESSNGKIIDGEDLALLVKKTLPDAKIVILTGNNESYRISSILKTVDPCGLLIKTDINSNELMSAFNAILDNPPYYSKTARVFLRKQMRVDTYETLDDINRKIIFYIAKGIKTKNLVDYIPLSLSAVEKRKSYIKEVLGVQKGDNASIVERAKDFGYI